MTEDKIVGWHYWLSGHEFEQTPGDSKGQGSLACCSLWGHKESDTVSDQTTTTNRKPLGFLSEFFSIFYDPYDKLFYTHSHLHLSIHVLSFSFSLFLPTSQSHYLGSFSFYLKNALCFL